MKRRLRILLLLITVLSVGLSAEPFYDKGNQTFSFTLGTTVPTFVHFSVTMKPGQASVSTTPE